MKNKFVNLFVFISMVFVQDCFAIIIKRDVKTANSYNPENEKFFIQTKNGDKPLEQRVLYNCLLSAKVPKQLLITSTKNYINNNTKSIYTAVFSAEFKEYVEKKDEYGRTQKVEVIKTKEFKIQRQGDCKIYKVERIFNFDIYKNASNPLNFYIRLINSNSFGRGSIITDNSVPNYKEMELIDIPKDSKITFIRFENTNCATSISDFGWKVNNLYFVPNTKNIMLSFFNLIDITFYCSDKGCSTYKKDPFNDIYEISINSYYDNQCYQLEAKRLFNIMDILKKVPEVGLKAIDFGLVESIN